MKKLFVILVVAGTFVACNNSSDSASSVDSAAKAATDTIKAVVDTATSNVNAAADTAKAKIEAATDSAKKAIKK